MKNSITRIVGLMTQYNGLTAIGIAFEGMLIIESINKELQKLYSGQEERIPEIKEFISTQLFG